MTGVFLILLCRRLESPGPRPCSEEVERGPEKTVPKGGDAPEGEIRPQAPPTHLAGRGFDMRSMVEFHGNGRYFVACWMPFCASEGDAQKGKIFV